MKPCLRKKKPLHKSFSWSLYYLGSVQAKGFGLGRSGFMGSIPSLGLWVSPLGFVGLLLVSFVAWVRGVAIGFVGLLLRFAT